MTKTQIIEKYGIEGYEEYKARKNAETKERYKNNPEYNKNVSDKRKTERKKGLTPFCRNYYELIENYELAKADNFEPKKWHLHHRLENYWSHKKLKKKKLYYNLNPEALIWLPEKEHHKDSSMSICHPEKTKWHKRIYEKED